MALPSLHFPAKWVLSGRIFPFSDPDMPMTREELQAQLTQILEQDFEFSNVAPGDNLRDVHGFDSIDAIELLAKLEKLLGFSISREEREGAMRIRTLADILDYIEALQKKRAEDGGGA